MNQNAEGNAPSYKEITPENLGPGKITSILVGSQDENLTNINESALLGSRAAVSANSGTNNVYEAPSTNLQDRKEAENKDELYGENFASQTEVIGEAKKITAKLKNKHWIKKRSGYRPNQLVTNLHFKLSSQKPIQCKPCGRKNCKTCPSMTTTNVFRSSATHTMVSNNFRYE